MKLQVVGCNHHGSSVDVRQRLAFNAEQARDALERWHAVFPDTEAVLLSTCNRVEVYAAAENDEAEQAATIATLQLWQAMGALGR